MRVTNSATYRSFSASVNDAHSRLNKSWAKISSGRAYETAAENPLAYYEGKKIDNQYLDTLSKNSLLTDIKNRLYQQELGARSIQQTLSDAKVQVEYARTATTGNSYDIQTIEEDLLQKEQSIINDLNMQYQDLYIYGGNDISTAPFTLSADGTKLTYQHQFPGETDVTTVTMTLTKKADGSGYEFVVDDAANPDAFRDLQRAMSEHGRVDVGYGSIKDKNTLLDTYTGGLNLLTGMTSDAVSGMSEADFKKQFMEQLNNSPIALIGQAALSIGDYIDAGANESADAKNALNDVLGNTMDAMSETEHTISTVYTDLGNKYSILTDTGIRLDAMEDSLTEQYTEKLGADPYQSIMEMYQNQSSYMAALRVSSQLMSASLFDFMR